MYGMLTIIESISYITEIGKDNTLSKDYAKAAIRDIFIQMPTRSVNKSNWKGFKQYIVGNFGKKSYNIAMKELLKDKWLHIDNNLYQWKKDYGPIQKYVK